MDVHEPLPLATAVDEEAMRRVLLAMERALPRARWSARRSRSLLLTDAWARIAAHPPAWDVAFALGRACARTGCWRQTQALFQASLRHYGEHPATWHNLAMSHWQLGELCAAEAALEQARALAPTNQAIVAAATSLADYRARESRLPGSEQGYRAPGNELALQLMTPLHAEGLFYHQRGGTIAGPTGLPRFDAPVGVQRWIRAELADDHKLPLTLIHPQYGPVGAAGLRISGPRALFHYWIAEALQGQGLGKQLVSLVLVAARCLGLRTLHGTVYRDNVRSRRVLTRLGFEPLACELTNRPHPQDVFCHRLEGADPRDAVHDLEQLCRREGLTSAAIADKSRSWE